MRRWGLAMLLLVLVPSSAGAVTLTVGGKWQRWADASLTPTIAGPLTLSLDPAACGGAEACSTPGMTRLDPHSIFARDNLYFELGHQFDWRYLTGTDRWHLARSWGLSRWRWFDSQAAIQKGGEDGLEGIFATIYADCATGIDDQTAAIVLAEPDGVQSPQAEVSGNTCLYIEKVARRYRLAKRIRRAVEAHDLSVQHRP